MQFSLTYIPTDCIYIQVEAQLMQTLMQMMSMICMMQQSTMQMEQPAARSSGLKIFERLADKSQGISNRQSPLQLQDSPAACSGPVQDDSPGPPLLPIEDRQAAPPQSAGTKKQCSDAIPEAPGKLSVPPGSLFSMHSKYAEL